MRCLRLLCLGIDMCMFEVIPILTWLDLTCCTILVTRLHSFEIEQDTFSKLSFVIWNIFYSVSLNRSCNFSPVLCGLKCVHVGYTKMYGIHISLWLKLLQWSFYAKALSARQGVVLISFITKVGISYLCICKSYL